jgi:uncharacterized delta-60 repeat protein
VRSGLFAAAASSGSGPGAPGVVTNVAGARGVGQISVTWTAPVSNGGSPITNHEIQVSPNATIGGGTLYAPFTFATNTNSEYNSTLLSLAVQPDGKIIAGGGFFSFNGVPSEYIARLNADGTTDTLFAANIDTALNSSVDAIAIQSDGKIVAGGAFTVFNSTTANRIMRLNADGTLDMTFVTNNGTGANAIVQSVAIQSDGKILVGGQFTTFNGATVNRIVRLNADGTRDATFTTNAGTAFNGNVLSIAIQSDDKILVGGNYTTFNGATAGNIVRLNADGTRDATFTTNAGTAFNGSVYSMAVQSDGKIIAVGLFTGFSGTTVNGIARLNADGTRDTSFTTNTGTAFNGLAAAVAIQSDGKIIAVGDFTTFNGATVNRIVRLNADGTRDATFTTNAGTAFEDYVTVVAIQPNSTIVVGGVFTAFNGTTANHIAGINADREWLIPVLSGSSDTSYTYTGLSADTSYTFRALAKNAIGSGPYSAESAAVSTAAVPGAPGTPTPTASQNTQVPLSWTAAANNGSAITDYVIQYSTSATFASSVTTFADGTSASTSATVTGLSNGTTYYFRVAAVNAVGTGPYSSISTSAVPSTAPDAPTSVSGTPNGVTASTVSWTAPASAGGLSIDGYKVEYALSPYSSYTVFNANTGTTDTSISVTGLNNGGSYKFRVSARNAANGFGATAESGVVVTNIVPGAPTIGTMTRGTGTSTTDTLAWTAPTANGGSAITGYVYTLSTDSYVAATATTNGLTTSQAFNPGYTTTTTTVKIAAVNSLGTGPFSAASAVGYGGWSNPSFSIDGSDACADCAACPDCAACTGGCDGCGSRTITGSKGTITGSKGTRSKTCYKWTRSGNTENAGPFDQGGTADCTAAFSTCTAGTCGCTAGTCGCSACSGSWAATSVGSFTADADQYGSPYSYVRFQEVDGAGNGTGNYYYARDSGDFCEGVNCYEHCSYTAEYCSVGGYRTTFVGIKRYRLLSQCGGGGGGT